LPIEAASRQEDNESDPEDSGYDGLRHDTCVLKKGPAGLPSAEVIGLARKAASASSSSSSSSLHMPQGNMGDEPTAESNSCLAPAESAELSCRAELGNVIDHPMKNREDDDSDAGDDTWLDESDERIATQLDEEVEELEQVRTLSSIPHLHQNMSCESYEGNEAEADDEGFELGHYGYAPGHLSDLALACARRRALRHTASFNKRPSAEEKLSLQEDVSRKRPADDETTPVGNKAVSGSMSDSVDGSNDRASQRPRTRDVEEAEPDALIHFPQLISRRRGMRLLAREWQADDSDDEAESDDELGASTGSALLCFSARASTSRPNYQQKVGDAAELNHMAATERAETTQPTSFSMVMGPRLSERSAPTSWGYAKILSRDKTSEVVTEIGTGRSSSSPEGFVSPACALRNQESASSQRQLKARESFTSQGKAANARAEGLCESSSSKDDAPAKIGDPGSKPHGHRRSLDSRRRHNRAERAIHPLGSDDEALLCSSSDEGPITVETGFTVVLSSPSAPARRRANAREQTERAVRSPETCFGHGHDLLSALGAIEVVGFS